MLNEIRPVWIYANTVNSFSQKILLLSKVRSPTSQRLASSLQVSPSHPSPGGMFETEIVGTRVHVCVCVCVCVWCDVTLSCS